jgi:hypothetical protein
VVQLLNYSKKSIAKLEKLQNSLRKLLNKIQIEIKRSSKELDSMLPKEDKTLKRESKSDLKNLKNKRNDRNYLNLILNIFFTHYQAIFNKLILVKTNGNYLMILQQS